MSENLWNDYIVQNLLPSLNKINRLSRYISDAFICISALSLMIKMHFLKIEHTRLINPMLLVSSQIFVPIQAKYLWCKKIENPIFAYKKMKNLTLITLGCLCHLKTRGGIPPQDLFRSYGYIFHPNSQKMALTNIWHLHPSIKTLKTILWFKSFPKWDTEVTSLLAFRAKIFENV